MSRGAAVRKPVTIVASNGEAAALSRADGDDSQRVTGYQPLLPAGLWLEAKFVGHDTARIFNSCKVFLRFEVVEAGSYFGVRLYRAFRVRALDGRPGPNGKFVLHARGDLLALLCRLLDVRLRPDRVSVRELRHALLRVRVRTVTRNHAGEEMPEALHYSVVEEVERAE